MHNIHNRDSVFEKSVRFPFFDSENHIIIRTKSDNQFQFITEDYSQRYEIVFPTFNRIMCNVLLLSIVIFTNSPFESKVDGIGLIRSYYHRY